MTQKRDSDAISNELGSQLRLARGKNAHPSEHQSNMQVPEQFEPNDRECIVKLEGDISEGSESCTIPSETSDPVHSQFVNVRCVSERVDMDGRLSMRISAECDTVRPSIVTLDRVTVESEREMRVEVKGTREEKEEEEVKQRLDRVRLSDRLDVTNTPAESTATVMLDSTTADDPVMVNAVDVRETFTLMVDRPEMESGVEAVNDTAIESTSNIPFNRMIEVRVEFMSFFKVNTLSIDEHGRSSHPHHSEEIPIFFSDTTPPTYMVDWESLALFIRW